MVDRERNPDYAVLTGDLIKSGRLGASELEAAREQLLSAAGEIKAWRKGLVQGRSEFFRGDSWQVCLADPRLSLRAALFLRARLRQQGLADSRLAIGIGPVEQIVSRRVSLSTGEAFVVSGLALDRLPAAASMTVAASTTVAASGSGTNAATWLAVIAELCGALVGQSRPRQSAVLALALDPRKWTQEQIATRLDPPATQQAVNKALSGVQWAALRSALETFETASW